MLQRSNENKTKNKREKTENIFLLRVIVITFMFARFARRE